MSRVTITRKDGTPTRYFFSDRDGTQPSAKTVYKKTKDGVKRMKGVHFDAVKRRMVRD